MLSAHCLEKSWKNWRKKKLAHKLENFTICIAIALKKKVGIDYNNLDFWGNIHHVYHFLVHMTHRSPDSSNMTHVLHSMQWG